MKYNYKGEFYNIDSPNKAYVLGLWYADGFVTYKPEKYSYFAGIKLQIKDLELLEQILTEFPFFSLRKEENVCIIRCNQKIFCEHLMLNGIHTNKSGINKNLLIFPEISTNLYSHFIRGYFDGDGSIYFNKHNSVNSKGLCFTGNNYKFIKKLQEILWYEKIPMKLNYVKNGKSIIRGQEVSFNSLCFSLNTQNISIIKITSKYLYKDSLLHMKRKYQVFNTWIDKPVKTSPNCPKCKSKKTQWQIKNTYIICRNCNKYSKVEYTAPL